MIFFDNFLHSICQHLIEDFCNFFLLKRLVCSFRIRVMLPSRNNFRNTLPFSTSLKGLWTLVTFVGLNILHICKILFMPYYKYYLHYLGECFEKKRPLTQPSIRNIFYTATKHMQN